MQKMLDALHAKHPGFIVKDVHFSVDPTKLGGSAVDIDELDASMAVSVREAKEVPLSDLMAR